MTRRVGIAELTGLTPKEANFAIEYCKDFDARRAAAASGYQPDSGYQLRDKDNIMQAIEKILMQRLDNSHITADWLLMEAVDNHLIARQNGNITASNTALNLIAKHVAVDALARDKLDVTLNTTKELLERLMRGRQRAAGISDEDQQDDTGEVSFL